MDTSELISLKRLISERIEALESLIGGARDEGQHTSQQPDDESARMELTISSAVKSRINLAEKQELARLRANLQWLESDHAGDCEDCGCRIPYLRLEAVPVTRLCIQCAQKQP